MMKIKKVEDGHGLMKLVRFALIPIKFELTVLDNGLVYCITDYGRIIIDSNQYDFKSSDIDTNFSFYFRHSLIDGIEFTGGVAIYLDCVIFTKEKVTPEFLLDELQKSHVKIISAGSILLPNPSEVNRDKEYLFSSNLETLEEGLYDIILDKVFSINFAQASRDITLNDVKGSVQVENDYIPISSKNCDIYIDKYILPSSVKYAVEDVHIDDLNKILPFLKFKAFISSSADDPNKKVIKINRIEKLKDRNFVIKIPFYKITNIFEGNGTGMLCIEYVDKYAENNYRDGIGMILRKTKNVNAYIDELISRQNSIITRKIYIPVKEYFKHRLLFDAMSSSAYDENDRSCIKLRIETYTSYPEYTDNPNGCYIIDDIRIESIEFGSDQS